MDSARIMEFLEFAWLLLLHLVRSTGHGWVSISVNGVELVPLCILYGYSIPEVAHPCPRLCIYNVHMSSDCHGFFKNLSFTFNCGSSETTINNTPNGVHTNSLLIVAWDKIGPTCLPLSSPNIWGCAWHYYIWGLDVQIFFNLCL